jgi:hypothetical protein
MIMDSEAIAMVIAVVVISVIVAAYAYWMSGKEK